MKGLISQDIAVVSRWRKIRSTSNKSRIKDVSISFDGLFDRLFVSWPDHSSISIFYSQAPLVKVRSLVSVGTYHHFATAILAYIYAFLASQTLHTFGTAVISKLVNVPKLNSFIRVTTISRLDANHGCVSPEIFSQRFVCSSHTSPICSSPRNTASTVSSWKRYS